jgi:Fe-S-cluster containining protein
MRPIFPETDAGDFDTWLADIQASFQDGLGTSVPCGDCRGCCMSSYFIPVMPEDTPARAAIPPHLLVRVPGASGRHFLLGHDAHGHCPMLRAGNCTIYPHRPSACRTYDCRVFAASGLLAESERSAINERVASWAFRYAAPESRRRHDAIKRAARFVQEHQSAFPDGRVPTRPGDLAILAIKVHGVFLDAPRDRPVHQTAAEVIRASRAFDAQRHRRPGWADGAR